MSVQVLWLCRLTKGTGLFIARCVGTMHIINYILILACGEAMQLNNT